MKLNHLNLSVTNVAQATAFFEACFGFTCTATKGEHMIAVLRGEDGFELVLMAASMNKNGQTAYPDAFHIGFMLESEEAVHTAWQRLKEYNIPLERRPATIRDRFGFYFHFDELMIEVGTL